LAALGLISSLFRAASTISKRLSWDVRCCATAWARAVSGVPAASIVAVASCFSSAPIFASAVARSSSVVALLYKVFCSTSARFIRSVFTTLSSAGCALIFKPLIFQQFD
jgi:hypothetical protein